MIENIDTTILLNDISYYRLSFCIRWMENSFRIEIQCILMKKLVLSTLIKLLFVVELVTIWFDIPRIESHN